MILGLLISNAAFGKTKITNGVNLDAEFRPRLEVDGRDFSAETGYDSYASFRTRLGLELKDLIDGTVLYIMIGDSRTMGYADPYLQGEPVGPNRFDNNLGVIKAYILINDIFMKNTYLKVGRMSNDQGRALLFGPGNWNIYGPRTYDGLKAGWSPVTMAINIWHFFGLNGDRHWYSSPDDPGKVPNQSIDYKYDHTLTGIDLSFLQKRVNLLAYLDLDQNPVADTLHGGQNVAVSRLTTALYVFQEWGRSQQIRGDLDIAWQTGTMGYIAGSANILAYMIAGDLRWTFDTQMKSWLGAGFHILSGDDGSNLSNVTWFYDKYCSKHRVLGHMDYFSSDTGIKSLGIRDLILRGGITPVKSLTCQIDLHHFSVEKPFTSMVDGNDAKILGIETDATLTYTIRKGLTITLGIDFFSPADEWQGSDADYATFTYLVLQASL